MEEVEGWKEGRQCDILATIKEPDGKLPISPNSTEPLLPTTPFE
jgi:hypothetical protein